MRIAAFISVLAVVIGCGSRPKPDVNDPDPAAKVPGMYKAVREKDLTTRQRLIADLSSDDPAVRFYAIHSLEQLTGESFGYLYYAPDEQRDAAVAKWKKWLADQEGKTH